MLNRMRLSSTNRPLTAIRHWRDSGLLNLNAPYQRGHVWGDTRRVNLIRSILLGIPIPAIIVNCREGGEWDDESFQYVIVDGKQRCTAVLMFLDSKLSIPGCWVELEGQVLFSDLPIAIQRSIGHCPLAFCEGMLESLEQETEVFNLVNFGGVPQGGKD
jgi:hypothetical protein